MPLPHEEFYVVIDRDHGTPANYTRLAQVSRQRHPLLDRD